MGATHVTVTIRSPAEPDKFWEGLFLVDTGATDSLVPRPHLDAIGLKPKGKRTYELADGNEVVMDITTADIEFMGDIVGGTEPSSTAPPTPNPFWASPLSNPSASKSILLTSASSDFPPSASRTSDPPHRPATTPDAQPGQER